MRTITMSQKEVNRLEIIQEVIKKQRTQKRAAEVLELSTRQVKFFALYKRYFNYSKSNKRFQ